MLTIIRFILKLNGKIKPVYHYKVAMKTNDGLAVADMSSSKKQEMDLELWEIIQSEYGEMVMDHAQVIAITYVGCTWESVKPKQLTELEMISPKHPLLRTIWINVALFYSCQDLFASPTLMKGTLYILFFFCFAMSEVED